MARSSKAYKSYFESFFQAQDEKTKTKIIYVIRLILESDHIPKDIYEIRINYGNSALRVFCFFDKGNTLVLLNGFIKKSRKIPPREIRLAKRLKMEYHEDKI